MSTSQFSTIPSASGGVSIASLTLALQENQISKLLADRAACKWGCKSKNAASSNDEQVDDPEKKLVTITKKFSILH
ncbi:hypothetical protein BDN71DRAFT_1504111 [Pleurotus eryngii]|uniref:Uncharacterized protein n=1 Tax=Pleurotus eryngii TaxID=5323 RepID=A0A9P6DIT3_PLEER|nr:hypothetical protein BDN71DRAFT_1504111 [Pleurotus eryngii]